MLRFLKLFYVNAEWSPKRVAEIKMFSKIMIVFDIYKIWMSHNE
jgi:hypothetical protein